MTFDKIFPVLRLILGDEQIHGLWNYDEDKLTSAIRTAFLIGRCPAGYTLSDDQYSMTPDLKTGDDFALLSYEACLLIIGGEDGAVRMHTRAASLTDEGHRKRDLMLELRQQIYEIRDGTAVFQTYQNLFDFLTTLNSETFPTGFSEANLVSKFPDINI